MRKKSQRNARISVTGAIVLSGAALAANKASATLILQDGFDYTTPGNLAGNTNPYENQVWGNTGTGAGPSVISGNLTYPVTNPPSQLTGPNSIDVVNNAAAPRIALGNPTVAYSDANTPNTTLYYSAMMNVISTTGLLTTTGGGFVAGFNNLTGTQAGVLSAGAAALLIRKDTAASTSYHLGIAQNATTTAQRVYDNTTSYTQGQTLFIVAAYNIGSTAGDDTADFWVYTGGSVPLTPGSATIHGPYGGEISTTVDSLSSFFFRDSGGGTGTEIQFDDLRVGTSWADVTADQVPEPASLCVLGLGGLALLRGNAQPDL